MPTGTKIKEIRKQKGLTQKQLGDLCGIADSNIRKYENGKQNPKIETLQKIATALASTLIIECLRQGKKVSWDAANTNSIGLAEKLGFEYDSKYSIYNFKIDI